MTKRTIISVAFCFIGGVATVGMLAALSYGIKNTKGSFLRSFRSHAITEILTLDLGINSYYLAGTTHSNLYLGNYSAPLFMLIIDYPSGDTSHVIMEVEGVFDQKFWAVTTKIDSPYFYVHDGAVPRIYRGDISDWRASRFQYDTEYFMDLEPVSKNLLAIRSLTGKDPQNELGRISVIEEPHFMFNEDILSKQIDGFFCSDGYLAYEKIHSKLTYVYRYRNEFIVMDTLLIPVYKATTLDTNSVAKIELAAIESSRTKVFKNPPLVVNDLSAVSGNYLFVKSMLLATNEPETERKGASAIDVYNLMDGRYLSSFYVYDYDGKETLREMKVFGNTLIALFQTHLQVFKLNEHDFPAM